MPFRYEAYPIGHTELAVPLSDLNISDEVQHELVERHKQAFPTEKIGAIVLRCHTGMQEVPHYENNTSLLRNSVVY